MSRGFRDLKNVAGKNKLLKRTIEDVGVEVESRIEVEGGVEVEDGVEVEGGVELKESEGR